MIFIYDSSSSRVTKITAFHIDLIAIFSIQSFIEVLRQKRESQSLFKRHKYSRRDVT